MRKMLHGMAMAGILLCPVLAGAQDKPQDNGQAQTAQPSPAAPPGQQQNIAVPGSPNLTVASVKAEGGHRMSKIVGAAVYNGSNQQIGTVDDIIMDNDGKATLAVIGVGGFLGVGSKLVAEPYSALKFDAGKVMLPDASKDSLTGMPSFTYAQ